jgi:hypothetical protein
MLHNYRTAEQPGHRIFPTGNKSLRNGDPNLKPCSQSRVNGLYRMKQMSNGFWNVVLTGFRPGRDTQDVSTLHIGLGDIQIKGTSCRSNSSILSSRPVVKDFLVV